MLVLPAAITVCGSIFEFAWLVAITLGITISTIGREISAITAGIEIWVNYKKKRRKNVIKQCFYENWSSNF